MGGYRDFSEFYDRLMTDVDYEGRAKYLLSLFERYGSRPATVLDIACGSGSLCEALIGHGVDPIGVDASGEMLAKAMEKPTLIEQQVLLLQQDMRELDLYGTADGAVCILDSVNHLCKTQDVKRFLERLRYFVEPNGLFIFDVNTPYKHQNVLADNAFVFEQDDFVCVWQNHYAPKTAITTMTLDFFVREEDDRYTRLFDVVRERAYSLRTLKKLLEQTGWICLDVLEDGTFDSPTDTTERWVIVAKNGYLCEGDCIQYE